MVLKTTTGLRSVSSLRSIIFRIFRIDHFLNVGDFCIEKKNKLRTRINVYQIFHALQVNKLKNLFKLAFSADFYFVRCFFSTQFSVILNISQIFLAVLNSRLQRKTEIKKIYDILVQSKQSECPDFFEGLKHRKCSYERLHPSTLSKHE